MQVFIPSYPCFIQFPASSPLQAASAAAMRRTWMPRGGVIYMSLNTLSMTRNPSHYRAGGFSGSNEEDMDAPRWGHKHAPPIRAASSASTDSSGPPTERKRLQLAPRSTTAGDSAGDSAASSAPTGDAKDDDRPKKVRSMKPSSKKRRAMQRSRQDMRMMISLVNWLHHH